MIWWWESGDSKNVNKKNSAFEVDIKNVRFGKLIVWEFCLDRLSNRFLTTFLLILRAFRSFGIKISLLRQKRVSQKCVGNWDFSVLPSYSFVLFCSVLVCLCYRWTICAKLSYLFVSFLNGIESHTKEAKRNKQSTFWTPKKAMNEMNGVLHAKRIVHIRFQ